MLILLYIKYTTKIIKINTIRDVRKCVKTYNFEIDRYTP